MRPSHRFARTARSLLVAAAICMAPRASEATWSIIIVDTRTGEIAIGSATCLSGFDLELNASIVVPGIGAAAAQSFVDQSGLNRVFVHDHMLRGTSPDQIFNLLSFFDSGHQTRQYGIVDLRDGGRAGTFTGTGAGHYRGGRTGRVVGAGPTGGDLVYAVQGNVLTGAPVIDAAVAAIETGPGDVPERLMLSMEAAMRMGGDGRCSCSPGNPTGCGAPPDEFVRTAYIAYMIISRDGDRDGCNGLYRLNGSTPNAIVAADLNGDGAPELITCNQNSSSVTVLVNTIASGWATYLLPMNFPVGASPRDLVAADFNGDGFTDVATANFNTDNVTILRGQANGVLTGRMDFGVGDGPASLVAADFDGDGDVDLAVINQNVVGMTVQTNDGAGAFSAAGTLVLPAAPTAISGADLDADGDTDLVVSLASMPNSSLMVIRNTTPEGGMTDFSPDAPIPVGRGVSAVAIGHLNDDERLDLAALAATDAQINVLIQNKSGGFDAPTNLTLAAQAVGLSIGDVTGDGRADIVSAVRTAPQRFGYLAGLTEGGFAPARYFNIGFVPAKFTLADLDLDSDLDFAAPLFGNANALTVRNFGDGLFNSGAGCASGDYWINLNVANVPATAPDPVPILRSQLDGRRADLLGETDAVRSIVVLTPSRVRADGVNELELVISLRDWQGQEVDAAPARIVDVTVDPAAGFGTSVGPATLQKDGTYRAIVTTGEEIGTARYIVRVQDDPKARVVQLMPAAELTLLEIADWDLSGTVNSSDFFEFVADFFDGSADFNHDGVNNSQDFFDYLAAFFGG